MVVAASRWGMLIIRRGCKTKKLWLEGKSDGAKYRDILEYIPVLDSKRAWEWSKG